MIIKEQQVQLKRKQRCMKIVMWIYQKGYRRPKKNERFVNENGKKKKITKIIKYMDNGEINTEVFKTDE